MIKQFQPQLITGDSQSGKSRRLAQQASEALQQGKQVVVLSITTNNKRRLIEYAQQLTSSPNTLAVLTWQEFIKSQANQVFATSGVSLLKDTAARTLLTRCIEDSLDDTLHPHYYAARQRLFQESLFHWLQSHPFEPIQEHNPDFSWINQAIIQWQQILETKKSHSLQSLLIKLTQAIETKNTAASFLTSLSEAHQCIFVDDAQSLTPAHWELLSQWQMASPEKRQIIASIDKRSTTHDSQSIAAQYIAQARTTETLTSAQKPYIETLLNWCRQPERNATPLPSEMSPTNTPVYAGLFQDPIQEAQALANWILQQKQDESRVFDTATQTERPARWSDFLVLIGNRSLETLVLDAFLNAGIPIQAELVPLDIRDVQTAIYDTVSILAQFNHIAGLTGQALPALLDTPTIKSNLAISQQELLDSWKGLFQSFERLLLFCQPEHAPLLKTELDYTVNSQAILNGIYAGESGDTISQHLLTSLLQQADLTSVDTAPQKSQQLSLLSATTANSRIDQKLKHFLQTEILNTTLEAKPSLNSILDSSFFDPLSQLANELPDLTFEEVLKLFFHLWDTPTQASLQGKNVRTDTVRVVYYPSAQGLHAPFTCLPFLTNEGFPPNPSEHPLGLLTTGTEIQDTHWQWLTLGIGRSEQALWLSAHQKRDQQVAWPHPIVMFLNTWQWEKAVEEEFAKTDEAEKTDSDFEASSAWGQLSLKKNEQAILTDGSQLAISPTGINTYLKCPRQYFYRHVLGLTESGSDAANTGMMVHRVMEVFNRNVQAKTLEHTYEALKRINGLYFDWENNLDKCLQYGFKQTDFISLQALDIYRRSDLKELVEQSLEDLQAKGYFEKLADLKAIEAEKNIHQVNAPGLEPCLLRGKIDAIAEFNDGTFSVIDYKFYNTNRFRSAPDKVQDSWQQTLNPLAVDETSGKALYCNTDSNPTDYQLPLYYLALQQDPKYKGKIKEAALQLIRPAFGDNLEKGATAMTLVKADINEALEKHLLADINQFVLSPLKNSAHFEANPGQICDFCTYRGICESAEILPDEFSETERG